MLQMINKGFDVHGKTYNIVNISCKANIPLLLGLLHKYRGCVSMEINEYNL